MAIRYSLSSLQSTDLELIFLDDSLLNVLFNFSDYGQHGDVCFACTSGCRNQQVLIGVVSSIKNYGLDTIQMFHSFKSNLANLKMSKD